MPSVATLTNVIRTMFLQINFVEYLTRFVIIGMVVQIDHDAMGVWCFVKLWLN